MSPFDSLLAPIAPPPWHGESLVHILRDDDSESKPGRPRNSSAPQILKPWTLIRPGTQAESLMRATPSFLYWRFPPRSTS